MSRGGQQPETQDARYKRVARQFGAMIERLARGYEADPDLRRDLVQEIHAALWRSFAIFEGQCSEKSWTHRIAHNVAVTHLVSAKRRRPMALVGLDAIEELPATDDVEGEAAQQAVSEWLLKAIHRLQPADRQVMLLYLEDLSAAEIGEVTGLSSGNVAVRIHRIKALLSEQLHPEDKTHDQ
ncbi:MAG: RNA polymerase sigma factor [Candidatus Andeanibacterium colombiense]|uniref:RNA polymerase sigma factor n=1 Tax=Candidatus Andeanibacterium colombiense TaxID=3121345 RepID=A0AAJ5X752_9SPHN|nr:MAG: RNA polymerase sigma factor [Sphingomonadaceae bacterium]